MSIGSVLLNPGKPRRAAQAKPENLVFGDILDIFARILADASHGSTLLGILKGVLGQLPDRIRANAGAGLDNAKRRMLAFFAPLQAKLVVIADGFSSSAPADILTALKTVLDLLTEVLTDLDATKARAIGQHVADIIKTDLGLNPDFLEELINFFLDTAVAALQEAALIAAPDAKDALVEMSLLLRRLKRTLHGLIVIPEVDPEKLADAILAALAKPDFQAVVHKAACISQAIDTALEAGIDLLDLVPFTGMGSRSVGAGDAGASTDDQYYWYASWLLGGKDRPAGVTVLKIFVQLFQLPFPGDDYYKDGATGNIDRRNVARSDQAVGSGDLDFNALPILKSGEAHTEDRKYTFHFFGKDKMEAVARHSAWAANAVEFLLHAISIEKGDFVSNVGYMSYNLAEGLYRALRNRPFPPGAVVPARFGTYLLASFEGIHTKAAVGAWFGFWVTLLGTDAVEANIYNSLANTIRDCMLSAMTLLNYEGPGTAPSGADTRPNNREEIDGVVSAIVGLATSQIMMRIIDRKDYVLIGRDAKTTAGIWLGGGVATGILAGTVGSVLAEGLARTVDPFPWLNQLWKAPLQVLLSYWITLYTSKENDTDDGKYNPTGAPFDGYPDPATSPYNLPWEKDNTYLCIQGNQGIWSHNNKSFEKGTGNSMVYAYDFAPDQGDPLLASRDGVVVDFFDWCENDKNQNTNAPAGATIAGQSNSDSWNFICIGHDTAVGGHDKGPGGVATTTYAIYGHGRQKSVRRSFAARMPGKTEDTITSADIIGTKVKKGQQIMETGNTGNSLHNHVHMEVRGGPMVPPAPAPGTPYPAVNRGSLSDATLPFTFAEVDRIFKTKGVPQSLDWHTSANVRVD